ncbi:hypothetical protein P5673_006713 [Acropora cervicornis]|uniref:Uncharacterized protein n=1 Tax=Acropora cervicornis TaxID=6130 RepID=A0AAD9QWJ9_ACRCE|nr:hypothetical protein P5673_006713 [Acropora cervicornis]
MKYRSLYGVRYYSNVGVAWKFRAKPSSNKNLWSVLAPAFPTTEFELNIFFVIELTNRYAKQKSEITEHYRSLSRCSFTLHVTFSQPDKIRSQVTNY